ncbi:hypothetical protein C2E23DRAFT_824433 [Lenzites betulinus]|nr:hypothetical protein C2E23DRAFT_824433 [Lenzites betulinus]
MSYSYAHNMFANAATTQTSSTTTATLLSRFTTTIHSTHLPKLKIDAPEWDPSRDEVYKASVSGRWGAVGRERHIRRQLESIWREPSYSAPPWRPFEHRKGAPWTALDAYLHTTRSTPFDSSHMGTSENDEAKSWRAATQQTRKEMYRRCEREAMEELTESFNPFNPVNVAARAAAEVRRLLRTSYPQHARLTLLCVLPGELGAWSRRACRTC